MKIGLLDVDGHNFPNLALMKISAWHKQQGDDVEWTIPMLMYDMVYQSKVFDFSPDENTSIQCKQLIKGGTGYDLSNKLPQEIENMYPDYSLYNVKEAYGFLTRGCLRNCPFCIVSKKEGLTSNKVANLDKFWKGQKIIKLLDPNLLACKDCLELLQQLVDSNVWIDFTQGLDIRLMTDETTDLISRIKIEVVHFAWDMMKDSDLIVKNLKKFKEATSIDERKAKVYILTNYNTTHEEDLYRIYTLRNMGYDAYVMIYNKESAPIQTRRLQRWVNNKFIFRSCERFEEYRRGCGDNGRIERSTAGDTGN